jgi:hypothetical protein
MLNYSDLNYVKLKLKLNKRATFVACSVYGILTVVPSRYELQIYCRATVSSRSIQNITEEQFHTDWWDISCHESLSSETHVSFIMPTVTVQFSVRRNLYSKSVCVCICILSVLSVHQNSVCGSCMSVYYISVPLRLHSLVHRTKIHEMWHKHYVIKGYSDLVNFQLNTTSKNNMTDARTCATKFNVLV